MFMMIAFVSLAGFLVENAWLGLTKGYMDNRNMVFPFLLGYGLAVAGIYLSFGTPQNLSFFDREIPVASERMRRALYFVIVMLCVSLGEIALGKFVEKVCHIKWWDYSWLPLHITQYTSVCTSTGFSMLIVIFMDKLFAPLYRWYLTWNPIVLAIVSVALMLVMTVDFFYSGYLMYVRKSVSRRWRIDVSNSEIYRKVCAVRARRKRSPLRSN